MKTKKKSANAKIKSSKKKRSTAIKKSAKKKAAKKKTSAKKAASPTKSASSTSKSSRGDVLINSLKTIIEKVSERADAVVSVFQDDIVSALKKDHDSLREFLGTLKDTSKPMQERRQAYDLFSSLLKSHTVAEENAVYNPSMKLPGHQMHIQISAGFVEHELADDILRRMDEHVDDTMSWSAHANVLAEIVEHHLKEEERDLFPLIRKTASVEQNAEMLSEFLAIREDTQTKTTNKNEGALALNA